MRLRSRGWAFRSTTGGTKVCTALHVAGYATMFPQVIGMAATWDTDLVHSMGATISTEARAKYNQAIRDDQHEMFFGLTFWSPNINIFRDPRWGRGQETYGEDPFSPARLGVASSTGMQGDDPKYFRVLSTPKHYAVHSGPETICGMVSMWMPRRTTWRTPTCRPFAPRSWTRTLIRDVRLQRDRWRARLCQHHASTRSLARCLEVRRLCG